MEWRTEEMCCPGGEADKAGSHTICLNRILAGRIRFQAFFERGNCDDLWAPALCVTKPSPPARRAPPRRRRHPGAALAGGLRRRRLQATTSSAVLSTSVTATSSSAQISSGATGTASTSTGTAARSATSAECSTSGSSPTSSASAKGVAASGTKLLFGTWTDNDQDKILAFLATHRSVPSRQSFLNSAAFKDSLLPWESIDVYKLGMQTVKPGQYPKNWVEINKAVQTAIGKATASQTSVSSALQAANTQVNSLLKG